MRSASTLLAVMVVAVLFTGCVAQSKYDDLQEAHRKSQEQVSQLRNRVAELQQEIERLREGPREAARRVEELQAERDRLLAQLEELEGRYQQLAEQEPVVLPPEVDQALQDFAERHSNLVEYDSERGMVKFRSDLTFDLGSADLRSDAERTLGELAGILTDEVAREYEVRVVGHTDSVPIGRPETREKHPTNWHLSVHRAISVRDALDEAGVPALRTAVSGYSKYRPLVQNSSSGAERNRRVEIYLVPMGSVNEDYINASGSDNGSSSQAGGEEDGDIPLK